MRFMDLCRSIPKREGGWTVFIDEAQAVPALFDAVQHLYHGDKDRWRFILRGSSARRLRESGGIVNLAGISRETGVGARVATSSCAVPTSSP